MSSKITIAAIAIILPVILRFLRTKFWSKRSIFLFILRCLHSTMAWCTRTRIAPAQLQNYDSLSLFGLPPEVQVMVYNDVVRGAEAPSDLEGLLVCHNMYHDIKAALKRMRGSVVYSLDDQHWWTPISLARDQKMYRALTATERRAIDTVKFTGTDSKLYNWAPHLALLTLFVHLICPSTVMLFDAFTRHPATHDIDALANATDGLLTLATAHTLPIRTIEICNVPQCLVFFLGCRLLNLVFIPNMDIQAMTDELLTNFDASGKTCIEIKVPILSTSRGTIAMVTVHITKLTK